MPIDARRPADGRNFTAGARGMVTQRSDATEKSNAGMDVLRYPSELGSEQYPHYAVFYISKRESDIGKKEERAPANRQVDTSSQNRPWEKGGAGVRVLTAGAIGAAGGATGFGNLADKVSDNLNKAGIPSTLTRKGEVAASVVGAGVGAGALAGQAVGRDRVTLKTAIALYINNKPSVSYKASWADSDLGILGGAPQMMSDVSDIVTGREGEGFIEGRLNAAKSALGNAAGAMGAFTLKNVNQGLLGELGDAAGTFSAISGTAVNPFKAQLFKNMNFRTFSFDYVFLPKNESEYKEVQKIIYTFKKYMHPTLGLEKYFMGYPAEFSIEYQYRDQGRNDHLFKISSCALTDLKVEYGGSDFVTFKDSGGAPSEIAMSLSFTELELLTDERIEAGY